MARPPTGRQNGPMSHSSDDQQHPVSAPDPVPGHVEPGGSSLVWTTPQVEIRKASLSAMDNNAYLLTELATGVRLLIDAADDAGRIQALLAEGDSPAELSAVVTTHRHWDHHRALAEVVAATGAPALAGAEDAPELPVPVDRSLQHGDSITLGGQRIAVLGLRGHTPGSVALAWTEPDSGRAHLFTGDSLFPGGPGKTTTETDFTSLMDDLEQRVFEVYPDSTVVYPGHGDNTTLGAERPHLADWRARGW